MHKKVYKIILIFSLILTYSPIALGLSANMPTKPQKPPIISEIIFKGNTVFSSPEIMKLMVNKPGKSLDIVSLKRDIDAISLFYHSKGYTMANVSDVTLTSQRKLIITISEGWLREVVIKGNVLVKKEVIRREFNSCIGKVYNTFAIQEALSRVKKLGLFESVKARAFPTQYGICLEIEVKEKPSFWDWNSEIHYNLEDGYQQKFSLIKRDPLAQRIDLTACIGRESNYYLSFYNPTSFDFQIYATKERKGTSVLYSDERKGIDVSIKKELKKKFSSKIQLRKEFITFSYVGEKDKKNFDTLSIIVGLSKDTRDNLIFPSSGGFYKLSFQNTYLLDRGNKFSKIILEASYYQKIWDYLILDASLGIYKSWGSIPQCEWFHLKRKNIIHGYKKYDFWEKELMIVNTNISILVTPSLQGIISFDMGTKDNSSPEMGIGIGLKYLLKNKYFINISCGTDLKGGFNYYLDIESLSF